MKNEKQKNRGFTLIELLIVVLIIAILAAIAVPNFLEFQMRAKVARVKSDMRNIGVALIAHITDRDLWMVDYWDDDNQIGQDRGLLFTAHLPTPYRIQQNNQGGVMGIIKWITTPVAYITKIPEDPFAELGPEFRTDQGADHLVTGDWPPPWCVFYVDNEREIPGDNDGGFNLVKNEWMLISVGPDGMWNSRSGPGDAQYVPFGAYDPTNGTISKGDILYSSHGNFDALITQRNNPNLPK